MYNMRTNELFIGHLTIGEAFRFFKGRKIYEYLGYNKGRHYYIEFDFGTRYHDARKYSTRYAGKVIGVNV